MAPIITKRDTLRKKFKKSKKISTIKNQRIPTLNKRE
jgi:hypothetical protein